MFTTSKELRIEISTNCNYNCVMCPRSSFRRPGENMSNELFDLILNKSVRELKHITSFTFSGFGEFAMDPDWRYKLERASQHFSTIHILTNLSLLSFEDLDFILNRITDIRISLYGIDEKSYRETHHPPKSVSYEQIVEKVNYLIKHKSSYQKVLLNYLQLKDNQGNTNKWLGIWKSKADHLEVWKPHNWIDGKQYRSISSTRKPTCGRPFHGPVQIQVDGTLTVCCFDYNGELEIGDLKNQSFEEIFNGDKMNEIRRKHLNNQADTISVCKQCDQRNSGNEHKNALIYSSVGSIEERLNKTSTEFEDMSK